jgi:hypothetical protein
MSAPIPVIVFAYARPVHLARVLASLRENRVPRIVAYADGVKGAGDAERVAEVRRQLRGIDWCETRIVERSQNLGLGRNVLSGVSEVAAGDDAFIVWEDDLVAVPGTYDWMVAALRYYASAERVMSVTAWTHPRVTPRDVGSAPYFDGRAECWVWGTWARAWRGITEQNAWEKMLAAERSGIGRRSYGADLPGMAQVEERRNIWAVRWLYHHLQHGGLGVRPPWSMVEHIGFDELATNSQFSSEWTNPPLRAAPPIPVRWPEPREHPECRRLWRRAYPSRLVRLWRRLRLKLRPASSAMP